MKRIMMGMMIAAAALGVSSAANALPAQCSGACAVDMTGSNTFPNSAMTQRTVGFLFSVDAGAVYSFNYLGVWDQGSDGLGENHLVRVWECTTSPGCTTQSLVTSLLVGSGPTVLVGSAVTSAIQEPIGSWRFQALGMTVTLDNSGGTSAKEYLIGADYSVDNADAYRANFAAGGNVDDTGINWIEARATATNTTGVPTNTQTNDRWFGPNLLLDEPDGIPEPAALTLFGFGVLALGSALRRRRRA